MLKSLRSLALLLAVVCLFIFTASALASGHNMGHECTGEDCLICIALSVREKALASIVLLAVVAFALTLSPSSSYIENTVNFINTAFKTPVRLKVKLSD